MEKEKRIGELFNILIQFEKISEPDSNVNEFTYKGYLDKLVIWYLGYGNLEIANYIKGLQELGKDADHDSVRRTVFHMISVLKKDFGDDDAT